MKLAEYLFPEKKVSYYFDSDFSYLDQIVTKENTILVTDANVFQLHQKKFSGWKTIVINAGERFKQQTAVDEIINELIAIGADRSTTIVGVGGGVVTDIAGYAAGIYMRGVKFGFVPTTILAMVDASIGGKNGVDVGLYKNLVGLIKQPDFLLFDYSFLDALPQDQWVNGFAEIIKHACIKDAELFSYLENESLATFQLDKIKLAELIERNVGIKTTVVVNDELEKGDRMLLNFGHTLGHAIENIHELPHGHAVSIGMVAACTISAEVNNFSNSERQRVTNLLTKYHLPVTIQFDRSRIFDMLRMDKKRTSKGINFILLNKIGDAIVRSVPIDQLEELINKSL